MDVLIINPVRLLRKEVRVLADGLEPRVENVCVMTPDLTPRSELQRIDVEFVQYDTFLVPSVRYPVPTYSGTKALQRVASDFDIVLIASHIYPVALFSAVLSKLDDSSAVHIVDSLPGINWSYGNAIVDTIAKLYLHTAGRCSLILSDRTVALGNYLLEDLSTFVDRDDVEVIHNGVSIPDVDVDGCCGDPVQLLYVGRLDPVKDLRTLLRSFRALTGGSERDYELTIVGDGTKKETYERLARTLEISDAVEFEGYQERVSEYYRESDIALLTSISEGLPSVLIEAQSYGVPVVTTDVGGVTEIVAGGTVVDSRDPETIAAAIDDLVDEYGETLCRDARQHIRDEFSTEEMIDNYESLFDDLSS